MKGADFMQYSSKRSFWKLLGALLLVIMSTAFLVYKYYEEKAYYDQWKDYEDCGVQ